MTHNDRSTAFLSPLPLSCIRGPELSDLTQIADAIASTDGAALYAYAQGIELIITIQALEQDLARLEELKQTRMFLIEQLELMECEYPRAFDRTRAAFDRQQCQQAPSDAPQTLPLEAEQP